MFPCILLSNRWIKVAAVAVCGLFAASATNAQIFLHDEAVNGDISDDFYVPDFFTLPSGSSFLRLNINSADTDLFTITLPVGQQLDSLVVRDYQSVLGNISFLGFQVGEMLTSPPSSDFPDPIDYVIFGDWAVNEDVLPLMVQTNPDLEAPLTERSLAFWANETGAASSLVLEFQTSASVPEPSTTVLLLAGLCAIAGTRRKLTTG